jgi:hypothetical protein
MASDCAEEDGTNISAVSVGPFLTWFVTVRDGHWARRFGNRGLGRYWGLRGRERQGTGENYMVRSCMVCVARQVILLSLNEGGMDWRGMRHASVRERCV